MMNKPFNDYNLEDYVLNKVTGVKELNTQVETAYANYIKLKTKLSETIKEEVAILKRDTGMDQILAKSKALSRMSNDTLIEGKSENE